MAPHFASNSGSRSSGLKRHTAEKPYVSSAHIIFEK